MDHAISGRGGVGSSTKVEPVYLPFPGHGKKPGVEPTTGTFQPRWLGEGERESGRGARSYESNQRRRRTSIGPQADHHHKQEVRSPAAISHDMNQVRVGWLPKPAGSRRGTGGKEWRVRQRK